MSSTLGPRGGSALDLFCGDREEDPCVTLAEEHDCGADRRYLGRDGGEAVEGGEDGAVFRRKGHAPE